MREEFGVGGGSEMSGCEKPSRLWMTVGPVEAEDTRRKGRRWQGSCGLSPIDTSGGDRVRLQQRRRMRKCEEAEERRWGEKHALTRATRQRGEAADAGGGSQSERMETYVAELVASLPEPLLHLSIPPPPLPLSLINMRLRHGGQGSNLHRAEPGVMPAMH